MTTKVCIYKKRPQSVDLLDRMLNNTTLTTKKVTHTDILGLGDKYIQKSTIDIEAVQEHAAREAAAAAERRHARELKAALQRQEQEMEADKLRCLEKQKLFFEDLAKRVSVQRNKAEEERVKHLTRQFEKEKMEALNNQWKKIEILKEKAIEEALKSLRAKLRNEFALDKEKSVADALSLARTKFREREQETIKRTRCECETAAAEEAARVAKEHNQQIKQLENRLSAVMRSLQEETTCRQKLECDYADLEEDYTRFLDYTDGKFHSDYLLQLRVNSAQNKLSARKSVTTEQIEVLDKRITSKEAMLLKI